MARQWLLPRQPQQTQTQTQGKHTMTKVKSAVIYDGPSLIDGKPIVAIAVFSKSNRKTGPMVQTYILCKDIAPLAASKSGQDISICGTCPHRGIPTDDASKKQAVSRSCYVVLGQGPTVVYKAFQRGVYPTVASHDVIAALGQGKTVRLGTYGDPAAVPSYVWDSLISKSLAHTAYTHQSNHASAEKRPDIYMTSADSLEQARKAWANGERTFRVVSGVDDITQDEILCPASKEAGQRVTCAKCKLCGGANVLAKSIAIPAHGAGVSHIAA